MGLDSTFLEDLIELKRPGTIRGMTKVIEIGAQQLSDNFLSSDNLLDEIYRLYNRPRPHLGDPLVEGIMNGNERLLPDSAPSSREFWQSLGFVYAALEFDGHRDSTPLDLNRDAVPDRMRGAFHLVVNTGTTEHVANQDNAFRVIHDLVCEGGIMIHILPAGGLMSHGFVNYNPKFFWHLCRENDYEVLSMKTTQRGKVPVPEDIIDSNLRHSNGRQIQDEAVVAFSLAASLRKRVDRPFRTPLDLPPELMVPQWERVIAQNRLERDEIRRRALAAMKPMVFGNA